MKKIHNYSLYACSMLLLYVVNIRFAMQRKWVPVPSNNGIAQSEFDYFVQELSAGNMSSYVLVALNIHAVIITVYIVFRVFIKTILGGFRKNIGKKHKD